MKFQFGTYFFILGFLPLFIFILFYVLYWKKQTIKKVGDKRLVNEMIKNFSINKFIVKYILIIVAFTSCVFSLANLRTANGAEKIIKNGIDVMIALDVSKSMLAQDIKPTRLERAKQLLSKLIDKLNNDRVGIVVFAGKAYLQMPLTSDFGASKMYLNAATTDIVPTQGTVIADALKMCNASFNSKDKKYKTVVLISDGEDHDDEVTKIASEMADDGVMINTVGIGSPEGIGIIDEATNEYKKDKEGNNIITKLNEKELQAIAIKGNGLYQLFNNSDDVVNKMINQLNTIAQKNITDNTYTNYQSYFQIFLILALILLVLECVISEIKKTTSTRHLINFCLIIFLPLKSIAQNDKTYLKNGNEAYKKSDYNKAVIDYNKVNTKSTLNSIAQYNLGNALYKCNRINESLNAYDNALQLFTDNEHKSDIYYNKGVVLQNNKNNIACVEAYKNALKLNPNNQEARLNLQKALQQQKENKQPKENNNKKEDKKKNNENKKDDEPKPQQSKLSKKEAEEKLKTLMQQEKNLQDKVRKVTVSTQNKPEKDW